MWPSAGLRRAVGLRCTHARRWRFAAAKQCPILANNARRARLPGRSHPKDFSETARRGQKLVPFGRLRGGKATALPERSADRFLLWHTLQSRTARSEFVSLDFQCGQKLVPFGRLRGGKATALPERSADRFLLWHTLQSRTARSEFVSLDFQCGRCAVSPDDHAPEVQLDFYATVEQDGPVDRYVKLLS